MKGRVPLQKIEKRSISRIKTAAYIVVKLSSRKEYGWAFSHLQRLSVWRVVFLSKAPDNEAALASFMVESDDWKQSAATHILSQQPAPLAQNKKKNVQNSETKQSKS